MQVEDAAFFMYGCQNGMREALAKVQTLRTSATSIMKAKLIVLQNADSFMRDVLAQLRYELSESLVAGQHDKSALSLLCSLAQCLIRFDGRQA